MSAVHTLVVTVDPHPLDHEPPDVDFFIECPGVTDACRMWVECDIPNCGSTDAERDHNAVLHGKRHQLVVSTWSVPTDICYLIVADETPDAADSLAAKQHLGPGRYLVTHEIYEGCVAEFQLAEEVNA